MAKRKNPIDPRVYAELVAFGGELEMTVKFAGKHTTLRWLEDQSQALRGVPLPTTSVWRIYKGQTPEPAWLMVEQILVLCGVPKQVISEQWRVKWMTMMERIHAISLGGITPPASPGIECPICGVAVLNETRHLEYHAEQESASRRAAFRSVPTGPAASAVSRTG